MYICQNVGIRKVVEGGVLTWALNWKPSPPDNPTFPRMYYGEDILLTLGIWMNNINVMVQNKSWLMNRRNKK
jgi:hypothetical protein